MITLAKFQNFHPEIYVRYDFENHSLRALSCQHFFFHQEIERKIFKKVFLMAGSWRGENIRG